MIDFVQALFLITKWWERTYVTLGSCSGEADELILPVELNFSFGVSSPFPMTAENTNSCSKTMTLLFHH